MTDTVELPESVVAYYLRKHVKMESDIRTHAPEGVDVDVWEHISTGDVKQVTWNDGILELELTSETTIQERVARATRHNPAEYRHHDAAVHVMIAWDMDPETCPTVDIEVVK